MKTIPVRSHTRRVPDRPRFIDNKTSQKLWDEVVNSWCVAAVEKAFSEPLDAVDMPEEQRIRVRETY